MEVFLFQGIHSKDTFWMMMCSSIGPFNIQWQCRGVACFFELNTRSTLTLSNCFSLPCRLLGIWWWTSMFQQVSFNSIYIQLCPISSLSIPFTFNFVQFYPFQFHLHSTLSNFISSNSIYIQLCPISSLSLLNFVCLILYCKSH
jgi:hypothetical protein